MLDSHVTELITRYPLAVVSFISESGLVSSPMPLMLSDDKEYLLGHVSNKNPILKEVGQLSCYIQFLGANGYISPLWHEEQRVPTWNYAYCQLVANAIILDDDDTKLAAVKDASDHFDDAWSFDEFLEGNKTIAQHMMNAITVIRFEIKDCYSKFKLSQNRNLDVRHTIADILEQKRNLPLAQLMRCNV